MAFPVGTFTRSALLLGEDNGKLDPAILADTPGQAGGPTVTLVKPAARAWRALAAAAAKAGHTLKASGAASSYRTYAEQERLFRQRFTTSPVSSTKRYWEGQAWYLRPGMALAAVPGTSNHGWGSAVDTGEERDGDAGTESIDPATLGWLLDNEHKYGWSHEVQSEPWHIRYNTGDRIPSAVLLYEQSLEKPLPPKPTTSEEESMFIMKAPGHPTRFVDFPLAVPIDDTTVSAHVYAGVRVLPFTQAEADKVMKQTVGELTD
jgi:hypothetical protein